MRITTTITGADAARAQMERVAKVPLRALAATAESLEDYVRAQAATHHVTGSMEASATIRRDGGEAWIIGHDPQRAPHTWFVHWGTKPHAIKPRSKSMLRWPVPGGGFRFSANGIKHPGYRGDPWMTRAAAMAPRLFAEHLQAMTTKQG